MIIRPGDATKLLGIVIMAACAVFVCTLFFNFNIDLTRVKDQITNPENMILYDLQKTSGNVTSAISGGCLLITSVITLIFYIKRYIDAHKSELGILKALGYSRWRIARGFWVFGLSVFVGTAIGFGSSFTLMPAFYNTMNKLELLPDAPLHFNAILALYFIVLPTFVFSLLSTVYAWIKLGYPALKLMKGKNEKGHHKKRHTGKKQEEQPFMKELRRSTVRSRFSLVFFIAFAAFCFSAMTQMSFSMKELSSEMMGIMMIGIGFVLAFTTLFLATTTIIKSNTKTIAMLRVFGYTDKECGKAILNGYRPAAYVGFAVGTGYQYGLLKTMVSLFFAQSVVEVPEYDFDMQALAITLILFVFVYEAVMYVYSKRIKIISLKEIMMED